MWLLNLSLICFITGAVHSNGIHINHVVHNTNPEFQPDMSAISKLRALFFPEFYKKFDKSQLVAKLDDVICTSNVVLDVSTKKCSCGKHTCRNKGPNQLRIIDTSCEDYCCRKNINRGPPEHGNRPQQSQYLFDSAPYANKKPKCGISDSFDFNNLHNKPFPWTVQIFSTRSQVCTGTLIQPNIVMSTAVCIFMQPHDELYVKVRTATVEEKYKVKDVIIHDDFSKHFEKLDYNIALLVLNKSVEHVTPICLPETELINPYGLGSCYSVSWEREKNPNVFNQEYEALNVLPNRQCEEIHSLRKTKTEKYFHSGNMCAETTKKPIKPITVSGSPLACTKNNKQYTLYGLLAWSTKVNRSPYLYTNVSKFLDWINEIVKEQSGDKNYFIIN